MGLTCVQGYFDGFTTSDGTTQVVTITGLGAAPKMGIVWGYHTSGVGVSATAVHTFGFFADDLTQAAVYAIDANAQSSSSVTSRSHSGSHLIYTTNVGESTILQAAAVTAVGTSGSDGTITLNWTTKDATSRRFGYIVWTGTDIEDATVLQFQTKSSSGSDPITGMGFQPDGMFLMSAGSLTAPPMKEAFAQLSLGFTDFAGSYNVTVIGDDNQSTSQSKSQADMSFLNVGWNGTTFADLATITSADSDGFTLNYSAADANQRYCWVLGFKGPRIACGAFNTSTSVTSATPVTGLADTPAGAVFLTGMRPTASGVQADARIAWGGSDGTNEGIAGYLSEDAQTTTDTDRFQSVTQGIQIYDHTQTLKTSGDVSFGSGSISVNYDVADGSNAYEVGYFVLMPKAAATSRLPQLSLLGVG